MTMKTGARDGTRTRDLCRDRAGIPKQVQRFARLSRGRKGLIPAKVFQLFAPPRSSREVRA